MSRLRIKELSLENFRTFKEPTTLSYPESGVVCVAGKSGVGKTNLNLAIAYALGFCPVPSTALQSWGSDKPPKVTLTLDTDEGDVSIVRGKQTYLTVGDKKITSATGVEEKLRQLLSGVSLDTLEKLVYRPQKTGGRFLSLDDAEKKEFLGSLLSLDAYEKAIEETAEKVSKLDTAYASRKMALDMLLASGARLQAPLPVTLEDEEVAKGRHEKAKATLTALQLQFAEQKKTLLAEKAEIESKLEEYKSSQRAELLALKASAPELIPDTVDTSASQEVQAKLAVVSERLSALQKEEEKENRKIKESIRALREQISAKNAVLTSALSKEKTLDTLKKKLAGMLESKCYACGQTWHAEGGIDDVRDQIAKTEADLRKLAEEQARIEGLEAQLEAHPTSYTNPTKEKMVELSQKLQTTLALKQQEELSQRKAIAAENAQRLQAHEATYRVAVAESTTRVTARQQELYADFFQKQQELNGLQNRVNSAQTEVTQLGAEVQAVAMKNKLALQKYNSDLSVYTASVQQIEQAEKGVSDAETELAQEKDVLALLKGFLSGVMEEVLEEISSKTNEILVNIPNVSGCTIQFKTETTTKKGSTKKAIAPVITIAGNECSLKHGLSGGMQSAVELAVDLAVTDVVQARTGVCPQWVVYDESFDGMSDESKEAALEILKSYAKDKLIILNSHSPDFRENFAQVWTVTNTNGVSHVEVD